MRGSIPANKDSNNESEEFVKILMCEHCHTRVAVGQDFVCPGCRRTTADSTPEVKPASTEDTSCTISKPVFTCEYIPDTASNKRFRAASVACAIFQFASLARHAATHHIPTGANQLEGLAPMIEVLATITIGLALLVVGSGLGLGAGNSRVACILSNITCFYVASLLACGL